MKGPVSTQDTRHSQHREIYLPLEGQRAGNQCQRHEIEDTGVRFIHPQEKELPLDREELGLAHMQRVIYKEKGGALC